ncbi:uncharacterized protein LOC134706816 [Mytilus trossulus]|uniref:uncharacterized protein LOC134706816 n=1 Tax=Mytilus trossulus TaxID=6551 RepID=UPI0030043B51
MINSAIPLVLGICAAIFIAIAAFIPGWFVVEYPSVTHRLYFSLFYGLTCSTSCQISTYYEIYQYNNRQSSTVFWMIEFQVEVMLSVVICTIGVIILCVYRKGNRTHRLLLASVILFVIGGLIILVACGRILTATLTANKNLHTRNADHYYDFPFSLVPAGIGGIVQIVTAILVHLIRGEVIKGNNPDTFAFHRS